MKNILFAVLFSLLLPLIAAAQVSQAQDKKSGQTVMEKSLDLLKQRKKADPGTYQFITTGAVEDAVFIEDILQDIEAARDATREKIMPINDKTCVKILPHSVISNDDFVPFVDEVIQVAELPEAQ